MIVIQGMQAHQRHIGGLAQWVEPLQLLRVFQRLCVVASVLAQLAEAHERRDARFAQLIALRGDPFIVTAGQQVAPIQFRCLRQEFFLGGRVVVACGPRRGGQGQLKLRDIEIERGIGQPAHHLRVGVDETGCVRP